MSQASFYVVYDGPALQNNQMEVRDLAPALLALGEVLEEANHAINGEHIKISLNVKASFKTGCFGIEFDVAQGLLDQALGLFRQSPVAKAEELLGYLGFIYTSAHVSYKGLVGFIKWLRGRKIKEVELLNDGKVRVVLDDESIEIEERVLDLYRRFHLRRALEQVVAQPLQREGIDSFAASAGPESEHFTEVTKDEAVWYKAPEMDEEEIEDKEETTNLQLVNVAFREDNKWRFSDGSGSFYATISDTHFATKVQHNEVSFSKGDILKVRLRKRQWIVGEDMKSEYEVLEVLDHRRAAAQLPLITSNPDESTGD